MKLLFRLSLILLVFSFIVSSCNNEETYADQLKAEKELIADFISRNNITVVETEPTTVPYPENVYFKTSTGLYIHISNAGDKVDSLKVEVNDKIVMRYIKYTLNTTPDTSSYLNTVDNTFPTTFNFYDLSQTNICSGWHEAVSYMKYNDAEAKVIVYSKLGTSDDQSAVIPYGYDIRIKVRK